MVAVNDVFKTILITGASQVGKTIMLIYLAKNHGKTYVTMDDIRNREY
ncbi:MAG: hypothetical protein PUB54_01105 [Lachnospiraceae bacterium]|nr:hypothetical protein [Lachnospiraceae bacterium]